ncbi:hypothetical protein Dsin_010352 [Dipteronia sinensis]|uniref:BURP domain-containing protein n=1 Tax=Dipteronia sinensis TaxID=43782 RepID=A0AAE0ECZ2_9ROSI|nr:hypothetical protein Dsin_010352 [Dipteronia sinensis]
MTVKGHRAQVRRNAKTVSVEDMIDFAMSVLGRDVALRTIESIKGSKQNILIGSVKGINSSKVTKSISCHQSLFPFFISATLYPKFGFTKQIFWILKPRPKSTTEFPFGFGSGKD